MSHSRMSKSCHTMIRRIYVTRALCDIIRALHCIKRDMYCIKRVLQWALHSIKRVMSHTHMSELYHTMVLRIHVKRALCHIKTALHSNKTALHLIKRVMSHTHMSESCHTMIRKIHVCTKSRESRHTLTRMATHTVISHTHMSESRHTP